jgi:RecJ-like exonuclease
MEQLIIDVAASIKEAVQNHRPVIIRHHADTDGICAGLLLEKACRSLIPEKGRRIDRYVMRKPMVAPFYEITDCLKDLNHIDRFMEGQDPMIVLVDNGSTEQDEFALSVCKELEVDVIVIDHHYPAVIDHLVLHHLNPYKFGLDADTTASILSWKVSRIISGESALDKVLPALGAVGDKSDLAMEYINDIGLTKKELKQYKYCMDYLGYGLRNDPATFIYDKLLKSEALKQAILKHLDIEEKLKGLVVKVEDVGGSFLSTYPR